MKIRICCNVPSEKVPFINLWLNILKLIFLTYDWFCADGSHAA